jgi:RHS repeat-associated protein
VRDLTDNTGAAIDHINYDGWGNVISESTPFNGDRYKYTGREFDAETNLQYNRGRWYDPKAGRWISQDPIQFAAGDTNLYRFVQNDPTRATDPSGLALDVKDRDALTKLVLELGDNRYRTRVRAQNVLLYKWLADLVRTVDVRTFLTASLRQTKDLEIQDRLGKILAAVPRTYTYKAVSDAADDLEIGNIIMQTRAEFRLKDFLQNKYIKPEVIAYLKDVYDKSTDNLQKKIIERIVGKENLK